MTKKAQAKIEQGFLPKAQPHFCSKCSYLTAEKFCNADGKIVLKKLRCSIGGFKVGKSSTCNQWVEAKPIETPEAAQ